MTICLSFFSSFFYFYHDLVCKWSVSYVQSTIIFLIPNWNILMKVSPLLKRCIEFFQLILIFTYSITHVSSLSQCGRGLEIRNGMGNATLQNKCPLVWLDNNLSPSKQAIKRKSFTQPFQTKVALYGYINNR